MRRPDAGLVRHLEEDFNVERNRRARALQPEAYSVGRREGRSDEANLHMVRSAFAFAFAYEA